MDVDVEDLDRVAQNTQQEQVVDEDGPPVISPVADEGTKCVICYTNVANSERNIKLSIDDPNCFGNKGQLGDEVAVFFVVRKLLDASDSACQRFLKEFGNPSEWNVFWCPECKTVLEDAKEITKMIHNLEGKLHGLKNRIKSQIQASYDAFESSTSKELPKNIGALDEIRLLAIQENLQLHEHNVSAPEVDGSSDFEQGSDNEFVPPQQESSDDKDDEEEEEETVRRTRSYRTSSRRTRTVRNRRGRLSIVRYRKKYSQIVVPALIPLEAIKASQAASNTNGDSKNDDEHNSPTDPTSVPAERDAGLLPPCKLEPKVILSSDSEGEQNDSDSIDNDNDNDFEPPHTAVEQVQKGGTSSSPAKIEIFTELTQGTAKAAKASSKKSERKRKRKDEYARNFKCKICKKKLPTFAELTRHKIKAHYAFKCSLCPTKFETALQLDVHVQKIHFGVRQPLACPVCDERFSGVRKLDLHVKENHSMTIEDKIEDEDLPERTLQCPKCDLKFADEDRRQSHILRRHDGIPFPYKCERCPKAFLYQHLLDIHKRKHARKDSKPQFYECDVEGCGQKFKKKYFVRLHQERVHSDKRDFICELCPNSYKSKKSLQIHQASKHSENLGLSNFPCDLCDKTFGESNALRRHKENVHENKYPFYCSICNKGCISEKAKAEHETIHSGEKRHQCQVCGKQFTWHQYLKTHMTVHTGEKQFKCYVCSKEFRDRTWYSRHMETHSGIIYQCEHCGKEFKIKHNFQRHLKLHIGENGEIIVKVKMPKKKRVRKSRAKPKVIGPDGEIIKPPRKPRKKKIKQDGDETEVKKPRPRKRAKKSEEDVDGDGPDQETKIPATSSKGQPISEQDGSEPVAKKPTKPRKSRAKQPKRNEEPEFLPKADTEIRNQYIPMSTFNPVPNNYNSHMPGQPGPAHNVHIGHPYDRSFEYNLLNATPQHYNQYTNMH